MTSALEAVSAALETPIGLLAELHDGELALAAAVDSLSLTADRMTHRLGARLVMLFATDDRATDGRFHLHHVWSLPRQHAFLRVSAAIDPAEPWFPSIAARHPAANWFEREIMDFFGLTPHGHPNPVRVALHDDWPEHVHALRKDFPCDGTIPRTPGDFHPFRPVTGEGVFQVPVGPVHAGVIEPGHFRFGVAGEPVLYLQMRLFYTHKGTEKRFESIPWRHGVFLAQSISGDTSVGHALAHAHAVERLADVTVPPRARALRIALLELERLYNHTADIGGVATDVAFTIPASRAQAMRERLLRLHADLFGSRLLRGTIAPGGVARDLPSGGLDALGRHLRAFEKEFDALITTLIDSGTFTDRVDGTGILSTQAARDLGIVGMAARASGVDTDFRRDHPHDGYERVAFRVAVEDGGDVRARLMVRAREVKESLSILRQVLEDLPAGAVLASLPDRLPASASALGWVEGWRGPCVHWISTDEHGSFARVKITDPSFLNWPGVIQAVPGNIIPDFPVINKSFNLSYSGNDR